MYLNCGGTNIGPVNATQDPVTQAYRAIFNCSEDAVQCYVNDVFTSATIDLGGSGWETSAVCREG